MADTKADTKTTLIGGWERTNDILGHKPKFDMMCVRCKVSMGMDTKMQIRHAGLKISANAQMEMYYKEYPPMYHSGYPSILFYKTVNQPWEPKKETSDPEINISLFAYKCPHCAWFIRFQVPDDLGYLQEIYKKRNYSLKLVPIWEEDDIDEEEQKKIGEQLVAMGYWGGR